MSRIAEQQVSFADWELMRQGLRLEPLLQAISDFLDDQKDMIEQVRCEHSTVSMAAIVPMVRSFMVPRVSGPVHSGGRPETKCTL